MVVVGADVVVVSGVVVVVVATLVVSIFSGVVVETVVVTSFVVGITVTAERKIKLINILGTQTRNVVRSNTLYGPGL